MLLRDAQPSDLAAIAALYNHYVATSDCTMQCSPSVPDDFADKLALLVAEDAGEVVGFGSLSSWSVREGYQKTCESSVYVRHDRHRRGVGRALLEALLARATMLQKRVVLARIAATQPASVELHRRYRFEEAGRLVEVGEKFGRLIDVLILQRRM